jgi:N-methylhydantoinase B
MSSVETGRVDPISLEVARTRLEAVVEEMGAKMLRTAHSSIFYESRDFSVALLDRDGSLIAMGQYIPHHQGGMQAALKSILEERGLGEMRPGDIYLTNDAYRGGTHTADFNLFMPVFVGDELVLFCGATAHQIDIGGMVLGAYCVGATSVYQEGIRFPRIKAGEAGEFFDDFIRTFQINVRMPQQQTGDLAAMLASLKVAVNSVPGIIGQYSIHEFRRIVNEILDMSQRLAQAEIERIPDGVYRYSDSIDHDGVNDRLFKIEVALTIRGSEASVDFTGTDPQADGFINASYSNTVAACYAAFILFLDPMIPRNSGFFRPIHVIAPPGTLVNPSPPAPIGGSTTEVGGRVYDVVIGALSKAWKEKALGTWSMMWLGVFNSGTHPETGQLFIQAMLDGLGTGGGARTARDGLNATCIAASNVLIPNVEIEEELFPVRYLRREIKIDTGGPGKFRGGCALETEIEFLADCDSTILGSRFKNSRPQGIHGGKHGGPSIAYSISSEGAVTEYPPKITGLRFKKGDRLVIRACGGGGLGDPLQRERWRIEEDIRLGYVSPEGAARDYGYFAKAGN